MREAYKNIVPKTYL